MQLHSKSTASHEQVVCSSVSVLQSPSSTPPETVSVRIDEDECRDYTREEVLHDLRGGMEYLSRELPENHTEWSIQALGRELEKVLRPIIGWCPSPWSDAYDPDAERQEFSERNGLNLADYALMEVAA
jgi:hypothetical protein